MIFLSLLLTIIPFPLLKQLQEIVILSVSLLFSTQTSSSVLLSIRSFSCRALRNSSIVTQTFLQLYSPLFSILGHGCNGSCSPRTQICLSGEQELFHFHLCINRRYHKNIVDLWSASYVPDTILSGFHVLSLILHKSLLCQCYYPHLSDRKLKPREMVK